jgi:hypothetical protein
MTLAPSLPRQGPNAYTVSLLPNVVAQPAPSAQGGDSSVTADRTTGTLRVVLRDDERIEYQLTIFNEDRRTFTSGHVYRGTVDAEHLVATLFTGELLSSRYIQLRGTGSIGKVVPARALLDQFRESPHEFVVRIEGRTRSGAAIQGTLHP